MRAIAREEGQNTESFSAVLLYMEKLGIIDSAEHWKVIRELRNTVNREYEENTPRLSEFFLAHPGRRNYSTGLAAVSHFAKLHTHRNERNCRSRV